LRQPSAYWTAREHPFSVAPYFLSTTVATIHIATPYRKYQSVFCFASTFAGRKTARDPSSLRASAEAGSTLPLFVYIQPISILVAVNANVSAQNSIIFFGISFVETAPRSAVLLQC
jgi:hypothetical protein